MAINGGNCKVPVVTTTTIQYAVSYSCYDGKNFIKFEWGRKNFNFF